jgi:hypothetical protein
LRVDAFFAAILFYQTFLCTVKWNTVVSKASLNVLSAKYFRNNINNVFALDFHRLPIHVNGIGSLWHNDVAKFICHIYIIALDRDLCMPYTGDMGKLKDLDAQGVTDLTSYLIGIMNERERLFAILEAEQKRTGLGFVQYKVLRELVESSAVNIEFNA